MPSSPVRVFIGLGSNLGDRFAQVEGAIAWLASHPEIALLRRTELIETDPWGREDQPRFVNAVAEVETRLDPDALLDALKRGEKLLGREESAVRWGPRAIDMDILLYGQEIVETGRLSIPHPHLADRPFVVDQLLSLDGALFHPALRVPIRDLRKKPL